VVIRNLDPATRHIGLVVGYREIDRAQWRTVLDASAPGAREHQISLDVRALHADVVTPATRPAQ
jgi:type VI secretion system protein VasD